MRTRKIVAIGGNKLWLISILLASCAGEDTYDARTKNSRPDQVDSEQFQLGGSGASDKKDAHQCIADYIKKNPNGETTNQFII